MVSDHREVVLALGVLIDAQRTKVRHLEIKLRDERRQLRGMETKLDKLIKKALHG